MKYFPMSSVYRLLVPVLLAGSCLSLPAQSKKGQLKKGDHQFDRLGYSNAILHYEKYAKANPRSTTVKEKLGDCYRLINDPVHAEACYAEAVESSPQIVRFYYASMLMQNEKFAEAESQFSKYLKANPGNKVAQVRYQSCVDYKKFYESEGRFAVQDAGVNTDGADFCPVVYDDKTIILSSNREQQSWLFAWLNNSFLDLYEAETKPGQLSLGNAVKMKGMVNSKFHEATAAFTSSGDTMYFTRNNFYKGKVQHDQQGTLLLQTYMAVKKGKKWGAIRELNFNNDEYSTGHPALLDNGRRMIIVSDMPGSVGGTDLYMVEMQGNNWGPPVNMGPSINTEGNEMFPWVGADGTLFFASDGHEGLGGLDVFMSRKNSAYWSKPENLGSPINTTVDDFGLVLTADGTTGYFSSNREGGHGDDDIYAFTIQKQVVAKVVDATTHLPIGSAVTSVYLDGDPQGYGETGPSGEAVVYTSGNYDYLLGTEKEGYEPKKTVINPGNLNPFDPYLTTVEMMPVKVCNPTAYLDGAFLPEVQNLPPGTQVTIRQKDTQLTISPDRKFGFELEVGKEYVVEVKAENQPAKAYEVNTKGAKDRDTLDLLVDIKPSEGAIGKVFYIIYYNFDKHDIRTDASKELDDLVTYMKKFPTIKVEMGSHTDARGTTEYNMELSRNRAVDAQAYIVAHGIAADRITYKFYGESQLTNDCGDNHLDCAEENHQLNRRTEFKLIGL